MSGSLLGFRLKSSGWSSVFSTGSALMSREPGDGGMWGDGIMGCLDGEMCRGGEMWRGGEMCLLGDT